MIIDRLILKNFKRFRSEEIRFKDGITGILGNNGTGKSSIVQAIFFALYGVQATGISADYIVSSFASPKEKCEVRLDFRIGGDRYTIVRTFRKGKTVQHDATFHREGKLMATGVSHVETEVRRMLGMGPVDFKNTIYAAQKDLLTLLENTPGKRRDWFLRALGIDYLNTESQKILKERADAKNGELLLLEGELKAHSERRSAEELETLQASVLEFRKGLDALREQHAARLEKKKGIDEEYRIFSENKTGYTRLTERGKALAAEMQGLIRQRDLVRTRIAEIAALEQEFQGLEQQVSPYPEKRQALDTLRKLKSESEHVWTEIRHAGQVCADLSSRAEKTRAKISRLDTDAARSASLIAGVRQKLAIGADVPDTGLEQAVSSREAGILHTIGTLAARQDRLAAERRKLLADWKTIQEAGADGVCPLCRQTLGSHYAEIEQEFSTRKQAIEGEAVQVGKEQERITSEKVLIGSQKPVLFEIRTLTERLKMRDTHDAELRELLSSLQAKEQVQKSLSEKLAVLRYDEAAYIRAEKEVSELEKLQAWFIDLGKKIAQGTVYRKQLSDLEVQVAQKQADADRLKTEISQSSFDPAKGAAIEKARAEIDSAIRATETRIATTAKDLDHAEEKIAEHKKAGERIAELERERDTRREEIELLKLTRTIIADYVVYLMQVVRSRIEGEVSRIISEITSGRYEQVLLDEDFNLLVRDIDSDYAIDRFSGGEQDDIAVALRIALSRYLAELHQMHESTLLVFDEIFGSQDEERRTNLLTMLRTQESRFPQIILISHIPEMQGEFTNTLVVEMGTDLASRVKEAA
jgi:exonuclease SbcC